METLLIRVFASLFAAVPELHLTHFRAMVWKKLIFCGLVVFLVVPHSFRAALLPDLTNGSEHDVGLNLETQLLNIIATNCRNSRRGGG